MEKFRRNSFIKEFPFDRFYSNFNIFCLYLDETNYIKLYDFAKKVGCLC